MNGVTAKLKSLTHDDSETMSVKILHFPYFKNKGGRPSKYTTELADEICIAILNSDKGLGRLCKENKHWPCKKTIFNWLNKNKDFQRQYVSAKQIQVEFLLDELLSFPVMLDYLKWKIVHLVTRKYHCV
jgi:hypothetical protein